MNQLLYVHLLLFSVHICDSNLFSCPVTTGHSKQGSSTCQLKTVKNLLQHTFKLNQKKTEQKQNNNDDNNEIIKTC